MAEVESKKFYTNKSKNSLITPMKNNKQIDTLNRRKDGFYKNNYSSYYENVSDNDNENSEDYEITSNVRLTFGGGYTYQVNKQDSAANN